MKRFFFLQIISILFASLLFADLKELQVESEFALLMNADTKRVLYEKNAYEKTAPASITKIATALYALKEVGEDIHVKVQADQDCIGSITAEMQKGLDYKHPPHWLVIGGTHMSVAKGSKLSLEELLYGLMLISANDCANIIAKYVSGSISQFMTDLNDYLEEIGCENTSFRNPHGLHLPKHTTTAYDMAIITCEALKYPLFRKIVSTDKYLRPSLEKEKEGWIYNSNLLIRPGQKYFYPQAIGGKTGGHHEAQNSFVAVASSRGRNLVAVLMQCPKKEDIFLDSKKLFEAAFAEELLNEIYLKKGPQPFKQYIEGSKKLLKTYLKEDIVLSYYPAEKPKVKGEIHWHATKLPIAKDSHVADLILKDETGNLLKETSLFAQKKINSKSSLIRIVFGILSAFFIFFGALLFYFLKTERKN